jgi:hypothetical protein
MASTMTPRSLTAKHWLLPYFLLGDVPDDDIEKLMSTGVSLGDRGFNREFSPSDRRAHKLVGALIARVVMPVLSKSRICDLVCT